MRFRLRVAALAAAAVVAATALAAQEPRVLTAVPGDVVAIDGQATVFGKKWNGLIGVDLSVKPGTYRVIQTESGHKEPAGSTVLHVLTKSFPVRRLKVSPDFVNPPAEALTQIAEDNRKTAAAFARMTTRMWSGPFRFPVDGQPTSNFGTRSFYNGEPRSAHTGVDFISPTGTPVHAANRGTVVLAEPLYFTGNTVIVDYGDGLFSLFAHLSQFQVHAGDSVDAHTVIGLVGATGRVTGPHLHWTVRLQGARVDPLSLVKATATGKTEQAGQN